jgi:competence protein ComEC
MPAFGRTIEAMALTHPHADHFMGLIAVFERYRVRTVYLGSAAVGDGAYGAFTRAIAAEGAAVVELRAGDRFRVGRRSEAMALWPPSEPSALAAALTNDDKNAQSVVLRVEAAGRAALLTGDVTPDVEAALVAHDDASLRADFLKVAHHGSRFSSTVPFLEAVHPTFAAISVGKGNGYGHPGWATLRRLEVVGARTFRTDTDGTIRATFAPDGLRVASPGK